MLDCPYCDQPVIEGSDECDSCGHPLMDTHLPTPQSEVELGLLTDRLATSQSRWPLLISPAMPVRSDGSRTVKSPLRTARSAARSWRSFSVSDDAVAVAVPAIECSPRASDRVVGDVVSCRSQREF